MRSFLAVPVEEPALTPLRALLEHLRAELPTVRFVHGGGLHLTVHFFGEVSEHRAAAACDAVRTVVASTPPFALRLDHLGDFHDGGVLWCGAGEGAEALTTFALGCRDALSRAGFECEQRRYRAHCTLGRSRRPLDAAGRVRWRLRAEASTACRRSPRAGSCCSSRGRAREARSTCRARS